MEGWILFWKISIWVGVGLFSVLSVWVIIAGFGDIRRMFEELRRQRDGEGDGPVP